MRQTDLAYASGFFDGEGSITISMQSRYVRLEVACSQKYPAVLYWFKKNFGGNVYGMAWKTHGSKGVTFLRKLLPYLIVKNVDAQEAIAIWEARGDAEMAARLIAQRKERRYGRYGKKVQDKDGGHGTDASRPEVGDGSGEGAPGASSG